MIDTAQKRFSVPGVGRPFMRSQFPVAAKGIAWRVSVGLTYSGVAARLLPPPVQISSGAAVGLPFPSVDISVEKKKGEDIAAALLLLLQE